MATLTTTPIKTFVSGETVTPTKLNELSQSAVALTAGTIVAGDLAADAVTTAKILDANVTTAKIADANVTTAKIADANVTTAKITDANVTTAKIADANVTAAKLNGVAKDGSGADIAVGTAPVFGCRAWVLFNGTKDTTGAVSTANTNRQILTSGNVSSVTRTSTGTYTVNFTTAMPDANFAAFATSSATSIAARNFSSGIGIKAVGSVSAHVEASDGTAVDKDQFSISIFR